MTGRIVQINVSPGGVPKRPVPRALGATSAAPPDIALLLDLAEQSVAGDPSPSHTIAPRYGISADAVRKRAQRTRDRVHCYIAEHPEYADLAELPLLAKRERPRRRKAA